MSNAVCNNYNIDFSILMPALNSRRYDQTFTTVPNRSLPATLKAQLQYFLEFSGVEFKDDESCLTVLAEGGAFKRIFTPTLFRIKTAEFRSVAFETHLAQATGGDDDYIVAIKWNKDRFIPLSVYVDAGATVEFAERTMIVTLPEKEGFEDGLSWELPMFLSDYEHPPRPSDLSRAFKKGTLHEFLNDAPKGSSSLKMTELPENSTHVITGYTTRDGSFGTIYVMVRNDGTQIMANKPIESVLRANPTISPDMPATLYVGVPSKMKNGKMRVPATLQVSDGAFTQDDAFSLDW